MNDVVVLAGAEDVTAAELAPYVGGWRPSPPAPARRLEILRAASEVVVARSAEGRLVGFVTALTDGTFAAAIPLLEVHPDWQRRGIGTELIRAMLDRLDGCSMIDLTCDEDWDRSEEFAHRASFMPR